MVKRTHSEYKGEKKNEGSPIFSNQVERELDSSKLDKREIMIVRLRDHT